MSDHTSVADRETESHSHSHDGETHHHHHADGEEGRPADGPVLLDIGGDIGAAIIRLDDDLDGTELPILALDDPDWDPRTHTGVWRRSIDGGSVVVAVYPVLPSGRYRITLADGRATELAVNGGHITNVDLRSVNSEVAAPA